LATAIGQHLDDDFGFTPDHAPEHDRRVCQGLRHLPIVKLLARLAVEA